MRELTQIVVFPIYFCILRLLHNDHKDWNLAQARTYFIFNTNCLAIV